MRAANGGAERLEVHGQEREVAADVDDAQRRVELEAVDDLDAALEQDVLGAQVAVAVADEPGGGARLELGAARGQERPREAARAPRPGARSPVGASSSSVAKFSSSACVSAAVA